MDWEEVFSGLLAFCLLGLGLFVAFLLLLHLSSILPIRRTLITHLRGLLYLAIAVCASAQCAGVLLFLLIGPLPSFLSFSFHILFFFAAFLSEAALVSITLTRTFIVYQPVRFCNLDHEVVFKRLLVVNTFLALIPITVDLLYEYDSVTNFEAYLRGEFKKEVSVNLALEAVIFLVFASLLEFLSRVATHFKLSRLSSLDLEQEEQPGYPMMFLRWSSGPVTVTFFLAVIFHLLLDQVTSTYTLHISIGVPLVGVLVASLLLNKDAVVYLTKKFGNLLN